MNHKNMVKLFVGILVGFLNSAVWADPFLDWSSVDLGGGLSGYTFILRDAPGEELNLPWAAEITFSGVGGAAIHQIQAYGTDDVNEETDADAFELIPEADYTKALDSWVYSAFLGIGPLPHFEETTTSYYIHVGSLPGGQYGDVNLAYIVSEGDVAWVGSDPWDNGIARDGVDYPTAGQTPEPATLALLGTSAMLLTRKRKSR